MAGNVKKLQFSEGTNVTTPTDLAVNANYLGVYADDAAYVTANGAAITGSAYIVSSSGILRVFYSSAWHNVSSDYLSVFADDTAYVNANGAAVNGSAYIVTSTGRLRIFISPSWFNLYPELNHPGAVDYVLNTTSSSVFAWQNVPKAIAFASNNSISSTFTFPTNYTMYSGFVTVNSTFTVTVPSTSNWAILRSLTINGDVIVNGDVYII